MVIHLKYSSVYMSIPHALTTLLLILEGRFLTIGPPGKSVVWIFYVDYSVLSLSHICIYLSILYRECT